jgi:hypothetical protein
MSYDKDDFIVMSNPAGNDVIVNISKIKFILPTTDEQHCQLFFGSGEDDFITVKCTLDRFMDVLDDN